MTREIEPADIEAIYTTFAKHACEHFNEHKECSPQLAAVVIGPEPRSAGHVEFFDSGLVNALQRNASTKDALMFLIRTLLTMADAVVHVSESWAVALPKDGREPSESLEDHPDRETVLLVTVHTKERTYAGMSRVADGAATPGPIFREGRVGGRFVVQDEDDTH